MTPAPWYIAGPLLGLLIVGLRAAVNKPLGVLGGYIDLAEHVSRPARFGVSTFLLCGFVIGGATYAFAFATFSPSLAYASGGVLAVASTTHFIVLLVAGIAMGFGARTAGGCTSGLGLTGMSLGSPASLVAAMTLFATGVALAHLLQWL